MTSSTQNGIISSYEYDKENNLTQKTVEAVTTNISYNGANLPVSMTNKWFSTVYNSYTYEYTLDGNRTRETDSTTGLTKSYTYDKAGQLVNEVLAGNGINQTRAYTYDLSNNRISEQSTGTENFTKTYLYDKSNRLTGIETRSQSENKDELFYYDYNGNQTGKQTLVREPVGGLATMNVSETIEGSIAELYTYNAQNRLTSYIKDGTEASYTYNADGKRISKTVNGTTTNFIWNGNNMIMSGSNQYQYGPDGIESSWSDETWYYVKDIHGNVTQTIDFMGEALGEYEYDAFGKILTESETYVNPFRYCGEYYDAETGNIYLRNRYYNPNTGRFITEDPIKDGLNWYVYCGNNPVMFVDPSGYITEEEIKMYENNEMAPGAYSFLMVCTYYYYLEDTDEGKQWWNTQAQNFRDSGYTDTSNEYWNWTISEMPSKPSANMTKEEHYFRNNLNIQFEWDDFEKLNERLPDDLKWKELPLEQSGFHKFGQINNRKYVSACEHFEAVYTKENYLVDESFSAMNMGTYNYYGPSQYDLHKDIDVAPYGKWGNTPKGWIWSGVF